MDLPPPAKLPRSVARRPPSLLAATSLLAALALATQPALAATVTRLDRDSARLDVDAIASRPADHARATAALPKTASRLDRKNYSFCTGRLAPQAPGRRLENGQDCDQRAKDHTKDPSGFVDSVNLYAFAKSNPVDHRDPSGRFLSQKGAELSGPANPDPLAREYETRELLLLKEMMWAMSEARPCKAQRCRSLAEQLELRRAIAKQALVAPTLDPIDVLGGFAGSALKAMTSTFLRNAGRVAANEAGEVVSSELGSKGLESTARSELLTLGARTGPEVASPTQGGVVLVDSNAVVLLRKDPTLGGRILPGEQPVVSYVTGPELRNAVARGGGLRGVPRILDELPVLRTRPGIDTIIDFRGGLLRQSGRFGDGIIGSQAVELRIPLITNDAELAAAVRAAQGVVR